MTQKRGPIDYSGIKAQLTEAADAAQAPPVTHQERTENTIRRIVEPPAEAAAGKPPKPPSLAQRWRTKELTKLTAYVPHELAIEAKAKAARERRTISAVIEELIQNWIKII